MKFVESAQLCDIGIDFRDLLPGLNRTLYKHPFVPKNLWGSFGNHFDIDRWNKYLKKHRMKIIVNEEVSPEQVNGSFFLEDHSIELEIPKKSSYDVDKLRFSVLQTAMHELVHAKQFSNAPMLYSLVLEKQEKKYETYHSQFGEIEAFAHCIALEFLANGKWGSGDTIQRYDGCTPKVKRALNRQIKHWIRIYHENL